MWGWEEWATLANDSIKVKAFLKAVMLLCIHSTDTQLTENIARQAQTAAQISVLNSTQLN